MIIVKILSFRDDVSKSLEALVDLERKLEDEELDKLLAELENETLKAKLLEPPIDH